jgi:hypothetical protein
MGKIYNKAKHGIVGSLLRKVVGDKTFDEFHPLGSSMEQSWKAANAAEAAANDAASKPAIPIPDQEDLARMRRKKAIAGSRDSTVLTSGGTGGSFGPG